MIGTTGDRRDARSGHRHGKTGRGHNLSGRHGPRHRPSHISRHRPRRPVQQCTAGARAWPVAGKDIMAKQMLIDATHPEETRVVVVDGTKVEEFDFESLNKRQLAGNIYLAKVTRV